MTATITTCRICNRKLTNPNSIAVSMGPVCSRRFGVIFQEALAYATSIGVQLDVGRLRTQAILSAQEAYRQRIRRRRNREERPSNIPEDQTVNIWSSSRGQHERMDVEFSNENHARVRSASGNIYDVTDNSCTCPHYRYRLQGTGEACRHIEAYRTARGSAEPVQQEEVRPDIVALVNRSHHEEAVRSFSDINWIDEEERESVLDTWRRNRGFDNVFVHEDDSAWQELSRRAEQDLEYKYEGVLGGTGNSFGMELEFLVPHGVSRSEVVDTLYEEGILDRRTVYGYHRGTAGPGYWKLENDSSLGSNGLELVSPILYDSPETWQKIETICTRLKELGCKVDHRCGGHIHVGIAPLDHRTYSWQRLARIGLAYEKSIYRMGGADADRYARTGQPGSHRRGRASYDYAAPFTNEARRIRSTDSAQLARQRLSARGRYTMFNTTNIDGGVPALEMRYPNAALNHKQWQAQIQIANAIVHQAGVIRNNSPNAHLTPGLAQHDEQLRVFDECSEDVEVDQFRKFLDVLGNDSDRLAATWLFKRGSC